MIFPLVSCLLGVWGPASFPHFFPGKHAFFSVPVKEADVRYLTKLRQRGSKKTPTLSFFLQILVIQIPQG